MKRLWILLLISLFCSATAFADDTTNAEKNNFNEPWFTGGKAHQYLGIGSLALGALTAIVPKPEHDDYEGSLHQQLAYSATFLGGAAVASGLTFHYKDLSLKHFFKNPDNLHALLGTLAFAGYLTAVSMAPEEDHATPGVLGAASMLAAIKITW